MVTGKYSPRGLLRAGKRQPQVTGAFGIRRFRPLGIAVRALLTPLWFVSNISANPADTYGLGSRSIGMGGAVAADVQDFSATYYNPSGLVYAPRTLVSFGANLTHPTLLEDEEERDIDGLNGLSVGLVSPGTLGPFPIAFGIAAQVSGGRLARIDTLGPSDTRWVFHQERAEQAFIAAGLAVRPLSWLAIGTGLAFLTNTRGSLHVTGDAVQDLGGLDIYDSTLSQELRSRLDSTRYPIAGITVDVTDALRLAAVYRGQTEARLEVDAQLDANIAYVSVLAPMSYHVQSLTVQNFLPQQVTLAASHSPTPHVALDVAFTWIDWSAYQSPLAATASSLDVELPEGVIVEIPDIPEPRSLQSARAHDRVRSQLGAEWRIPLTHHMQLPVRTGYMLDLTPFEDDSVPNLLDANRHVWSAGLGFAQPLDLLLGGQWRLDAHVQWSKLFRTTKSLPGSEDTRVRLEGDVWGTGLTLSVEL